MVEPRDEAVPVLAVAPTTTRVFVSARGNVFMREIAEHLAEALNETGRSTEVVTDELPVATDDPLTNLVVAPHEFFGLFPGSVDHAEAAAANAVSINTEQFGTPFFERALHFAARGPVIFDINPSSLASIRRLGFAAVHLPLGYVASMDRWRLDRTAQRTVDLAFMGGRTPRRELFLGGAASQLWEWRTDLRTFSWHRPVTANGPASAFLTGDVKFDALATTRILLNVHRNEDPYFEWARVLEAAANGCVVVTETSTGTAPLVAGEHFVEAPLEYLAEQAVALAFDEQRRVRIADAAYEVLVTQLSQAALLDASMREARSSARPTAGTAPRGAPTTREPKQRPTHRATAAARQWLRRPSSTADVEELRVVAGQLKQTFLHQIAHGRHLERTVSIARHGEPDHQRATMTRAWEGADPAVSVVIPLYDQGHFLRDAVRSVIAAASGEAAATELVIVDDHSTDDSAEVAQGLLDEHGWFPITLVRRSANGGLPVARNTGFAAARAPLIFALDADNVLYPNGLRALANALAGAAPDVFAAYGILERFDDSGSLGVTSHLPWDVDLLVQGAYIDAMAMFRRDRWRELGGYADSLDVYGWEDYDLWLRGAARGYRAELVPSFVGRYREQAGSMRKISDIDMRSNFVTLRERHPRLPWPS